MPGQTVDVPIVLVAPLAGGAYRGNWKIQSPWGQVFGDSGSRNPFWVDIIVGSGTPENAKTATVFGITNVTYTVERRCTTANTFWHIYVNLTSNGPVNAIFNVEQSDGNGVQEDHNVLHVRDDPDLRLWRVGPALHFVQTAPLGAGDRDVTSLLRVAGTLRHSTSADLDGACSDLPFFMRRFENERRPIELRARPDRKSIRRACGLPRRLKLPGHASDKAGRGAVVESLDPGSAPYQCRTAGL